MQSLSTDASHVAMARCRSASLNDPKQAMELLRTLVQPLIDADIQAVMKKYVDAYFRPAANNARKNLGEANVSARLIEDVCLTAIDRARDALDFGKKVDPMTAASVAAASIDVNPIVIGPGVTIGGGDAAVKRRSFAPMATPSVPIKRKKKKKSSFSSGSEKADGAQQQRPYTDVIVVSKSGKPVRREGPNWEPKRLTEETLFILGSKANKALGYGQTRGRLYIKHPELLK
jgi:deoxynucleotidyltransferase terminal-interacting protein 1